MMLILDRNLKRSFSALPQKIEKEKIKTEIGSILKCVFVLIPYCNA